MGRALGSLTLGPPGSPAHDLHGPHVATEVVSSLLHSSQVSKFQTKHTVPKNTGDFPPMSTSEEKQGRKQTVDNPYSTHRKGLFPCRTHVLFFGVNARFFWRRKDISWHPPGRAN